MKTDSKSNGAGQGTCYFRKRVIFFILVCLGVAVVLLEDVDLPENLASFLFEEDHQCSTIDTNGSVEIEAVYGGGQYVIETPGCKIPNFETSPSSMKEYFKLKNNVKCKLKGSDITSSKGNTLYFFPEKIKLHGVNTWFAKNFVECCYQSIERVTQRRDSYDDNCDRRWKLGKKCVLIKRNKTTILKYDAIAVYCKSPKVFYTNVHHLIQKNNYDSVKNSSVQREIDDIKRLTNSSNQLSVIIFGTDSVSRLNFLRTSPKVYQYLTEDLKAFEFKGFNKVGDNTLPNLMPILTGHSKKEVMSQKCYTDRTGAKGKKAKKWDDCYFAWKDFKRRGYVTAFVEDKPDIGAFHYQLSGFLEPPTDHYGRTFSLASQKLIAGKISGTKACQGSRLSLEAVHDYSLDLLNTYRSEPLFTLHWSSSLTHDALNMAFYTAEPHLRYLKALKKNGILDRSVLFFMSDHGMRFGKFRETMMGKFEESLPYLFLVVPEWFREKFPEVINNLQMNNKTLVTPFDLYPTLMDIAFLNYENISYVETKPSKTLRSISLFQEIPTTRTCRDIGFDYQYCACQEYSPFKDDNFIYHEIENYIKKHINEMLNPYPSCAAIKKVQIIRAFVGVLDAKYFKDVQEDILSILANYCPGNATIEATIIWKHKTKAPFEIVGDISRVNKYGNQSHCIDDKELVKFCICEDTLNGI